MDKAELKRQLAYWEGVDRQNKLTIKTLTEQNKQVLNTIKFLRGLLGKDEPVQEQLMADGFVSEETR